MVMLVVAVPMAMAMAVVSVMPCGGSDKTCGLDDDDDDDDDESPAHGFIKEESTTVNRSTDMRTSTNTNLP
eukprot:CAMPEP_0113509122 /NCGR_PEP_ID=MMETSP0014_2-20120614/37391_1 /TAXON_ID=2857 /ORGANISM="Nitzschia sp." /LENGTH=70 /DNA_ID=CAMNT_0000404899 /DNA_START=339 /DNA_END=548 /DNA_ORIENTATION=+ /assembly_acc=CAM_ASM_000159